jgi:hypothetical protein
MPDIIASPLRCHRRFRSDAEPRTRRNKAQETAVAIDDTEIAMTAACNVAVLVFGETYELAGEGLADEYFVTEPLDRAIPAYASSLMIGVVPGSRSGSALDEDAVAQLQSRWLPATCQ